MNRYALVGIAAATFALAGCVPSSPPTATPTPVPAVTVTVTPTPTPTPERADYGFTFYEDAQLGSTFDGMSAELGYPVAGLAECTYYGPVDNLADHNTYAFLDSRDASVGSTFFYTLAQPDTATYPRNAEGVGVGSTQAELLAAYPSAVVGTHHDLGAGDIATVTVDDPDSDSRYVFGFSEGSSTVDLLQWGTDAGGQWSHLCGGF